jgi:hypothetical protein
MMCHAIYNPARCAIRVVIRFHHPKNTSAVEVHRELSVVYDKNVKEL